MDGWQLLAQTIPDSALTWLDPVGALDAEVLRSVVAIQVFWVLAQSCALTLWAIARPIAWRLSGRRKVVPTAWRGTWVLAALGMVTVATPFAGLAQLHLLGRFSLAWSWVSLAAALAWIAVRAWHVDLLWLVPAKRTLVLRRRDRDGDIVLQVWPLPTVLEQASLVDAISQYFTSKEAAVRFLDRARAACR
ncbi:MAG: hypothetical protein HY902_14745 [Deltaproteobacteria bacterium]|nr:hypothetical protein [Deltaproteobacteria bacterium]